MFTPTNSINQAYSSYTNQEQYPIPPPPPFNSGWVQPPYSSSEPIPIQNPRSSQQQQLQQQQQQQHVNITFIDQTQKHIPSAMQQPKNCFTQMCFTPPTPTSPASPTTPNSQYDAYKQSRKKPLKDALRSQIAKSRKRDSGGHFLPKGVCIQLEQMESELRTLHDQMTEKDREIERLKQELEQTKMLNRSLLDSHKFTYSAPPVNHSFVHSQQQQPQQAQQQQPGAGMSRKPFQEYIDFSQIQLRKSDSKFMTADERREVLALQLEWEEKRRFNEFLRKLEERWVSEQSQRNNSATNIYNDPIKIGNQMIPAFTEKIDFSNIELRKSSERNLPPRKPVPPSQPRAVPHHYTTQRPTMWPHNHVVPGQAPQEQRFQTSVRRYPPTAHAPITINVSAPMYSTSYSTSCHDNDHEIHGVDQVPELDDLDNVAVLENLSSMSDLDIPQSFDEVNSACLGLSTAEGEEEDGTSNDNEMEFREVQQLEGQNINISSSEQNWESVLSPEDVAAFEEYNNTRRFNTWGGPPSDIYTPPHKIGNLLVPAFTEKIDYTEVAQHLRKTDSPFSSSPPL